MKIAICDDEPAVRELIACKVCQRYPEAELSFFASGEELLAEKNIGDILFLDIRLSGRDGMETARILRKKNRDMILIFVTAVREYVFQAFDVGAFHYLVKPFEDAKFSEVLRAAVSQWEEKHGADAIRNEEWMAGGREGNETINGKESAGNEQGNGKKIRNADSESYNGRTAEPRVLLIKARGLSTKVKLDDIIYAEVLNRKITLHTKNGDLEYYGKLSDLEKMAGGDFFRPHRAYLVHLKYVERYNATEIVMERGSAIMAKQNYPEFVKQFMRYHQRERKQNVCQ